MDEDMKALRNLLLDGNWVDSLAEWTDSVNIFEGLRLERAEIRHSNMLAWLLDPMESHGLGRDFLDRLVRRILAISDYESGNGDAEVSDTIRIATADWDGAVVRREWGNERKKLDILLSAPLHSDNGRRKAVIAIENKIDAKDGKKQLENYRREVASTYPDAITRLVYLTPEGSAPENADEDEKRRWTCISYHEVADALESLLERRTVMPNAVRVHLEEYLAVIRRCIVKDEELIRVCNRAYAMHRDAFDLVFKYAEMGGKRAEVKAAIGREVERICKMNGNGFIFAGKQRGKQNSTSFQSTSMNNILGHLPSSSSGAWNNGEVYFYWFDVQEEKVELRVEFGYKDYSQADDAPLMRMANIINEGKTKFGCISQKLKRYSVVKYDEDTDLERIVGMVERKMAELAKDEAEWIDKYNRGKIGVVKGEERDMQFGGETK